MYNGWCLLCCCSPYFLLLGLLYCISHSCDCKRSNKNEKLCILNREVGEFEGTGSGKHLEFLDSPNSSQKFPVFSKNLADYCLEKLKWPWILVRNSNHLEFKKLKHLRGYFSYFSFDCFQNPFIKQKIYEIEKLFSARLLLVVVEHIHRGPHLITHANRLHTPFILFVSVFYFYKSYLMVNSQKPLVTLH